MDKFFMLLAGFSLHHKLAMRYHYHFMDVCNSKHVFLTRDRWQRSPGSPLSLHWHGEGGVGMGMEGKGRVALLLLGRSRISFPTRPPLTPPWQVRKTLPYCPPCGLPWHCGREEASSSLDAHETSIVLFSFLTSAQRMQGASASLNMGGRQAPWMVSTDTMRRGAHFPQVGIKVIVPHAVFSHNPSEGEDGCLIPIKWV